MMFAPKTFRECYTEELSKLREGKGPEIHSAKAHRCVDKVRKKGHPESNAWAICTSSIGKSGVYSKGHGGSASPKRKIKEATEEEAVVEELVEKCKGKKKRMYEVNHCHGKAPGHPCEGGKGGARSARDDSPEYGITRGPKLSDTTTTATSLASPDRGPAPPAPDAFRDHSLSGIASVIRRDWSKQGKGVNYAAKPYLSALASMDKITDNYGADSGESVVAYFLGNATSWRGPVAKVVKAELKRRLGRK